MFLHRIKMSGLRARRYASTSMPEMMENYAFVHMFNRSSMMQLFINKIVYPEENFGEEFVVCNRGIRRIHYDDVDATTDFTYKSGRNLFAGECQNNMSKKNYWTLVERMYVNMGKIKSAEMRNRLRSNKTGKLEKRGYDDADRLFGIAIINWPNSPEGPEGMAHFCETWPIYRKPINYGSPKPLIEVPSPAYNLTIFNVAEYHACMPMLTETQHDFWGKLVLGSGYRDPEDVSDPDIKAECIEFNEYRKLRKSMEAEREELLDALIKTEGTELQKKEIFRKKISEYFPQADVIRNNT